MLRTSSKKQKKTRSHSKVSRKTTISTGIGKSRTTIVRNSRKSKKSVQIHIPYLKGSIKYHKPKVEESMKENMNENQLLNKDLIKKVLKPNRWNFLNKISYIHDLMIAKIELPQFVEYFLGDALYKLRKNEESSRFKATNEFDWKLDQFKKQCQLVYCNSEEEDLKYFMKIELPSLNRWGNHSFSKVEVKQTKQNRLSQFRALARKPIRFYPEEEDVLERLNQKLDSYLEKTAKLPSSTD